MDSAPPSLTPRPPGVYLVYPAGDRPGDLRADRPEGLAMTETMTAGTGAAATGQAVIDCDIHNVVPNVFALFPYLDQHWRETINQTLFKGAVDTIYPRNAPNAARPGSVPANGDPAGSD